MLEQILARIICTRKPCAYLSKRIKGLFSVITAHFNVVWVEILDAADVVAK